MSFPGWIERQIKEAEADGAFDRLPGKGKPIAGLDEPQPELAWLAGYLKREGVDAASLLPPSLALAKEVETLPERLRRVRSEGDARRLIDDLNARILRAHALPPDGPPFRVKCVDVEATISEWARQREAEATAVPRVQPTEPAERRGRRGWFRRR
ncbi:DUF1992 domain-containing protein [Jatrophihabitans sp.]|uniref:DnaJ family domain-containing protein n=1 Tax=Jatrophihabitans sp. TaxID=1932789 RepID=UPI0030C6D13F